MRTLLLVAVAFTLVSSSSIHPLPLHFSLNTSTSTRPPIICANDARAWSRVPWRCRISRDFYISFTGFVGLENPDDADDLRDSILDLMKDIATQGHRADPIEYQGETFGRLFVHLTPFRYHPPPSRAAFVLVLATVLDIMRERGARQFISNLKFNRVKVATFGIDWNTPTAQEKRRKTLR